MTVRIYNRESASGGSDSILCEVKNLTTPEDALVCVEKNVQELLISHPEKQAS